MTFLPIVDRELQTAARRKNTYTLRMIAVFLALGVSLWWMASFGINNFIPTNLKGQILFQGISIMAFAYCLLLGIPMASDCISQEKRDGTLGFLFLTNLKSHDVILGKLAGTSVNATYCLLAVVPILALPLQLGGVSGFDVFMVAITLLNTLFFSLTCGLFVSVVSRDERRAMFATFLLIASVTVGPFVLAICIDDRRLQESITAFSPAFFMQQGFVGVRSNSLRFYSIAYIHVLSWIMLLWSTRILSRIWHEQSKKTWLHRNLEKVDSIGYGNSMQRKIHRRRLLSGNPYVWLASRDRWKARYVWILVASCFVIWIWSYVQFRHMADEAAVFLLAFALNAFIKLWVASEVCYRIIDDRRTGALELLLSTPMSARDYLLGIGPGAAAPVRPASSPFASRTILYDRQNL